MQRFEHPHRYAFAEVERRGNVVTVREGIFGHPGHARPYAYPVARGSRHASARPQADWRAEGYLLCPPGRRLPRAAPPPARASELPCPPALAAQIAADPDDEAAWMVWADWLTAQGDPRGPLLHPERDPRRVRRRAGAVVEGLPRWLGPLWATVTAARPALRALWRGGCIIEADLRGSDGAAQVPADFAACPATRFLRHLTVRDHPPAALAPLWARPWAALRTVEVHADAPIDGPAILAAAPRLESLRLQASPAPGRWRHPRLAHLRLSGSGETPLPLAGVFSSAELPALRRLEIGRTPIDARAMAALCGGPLLLGLEKLVLPGCRISDPAVDVLLAHAQAFDGLELLDLRHNALWHRAVELRALFGDRVALSEAPIYY